MGSDIKQILQQKLTVVMLVYVEMFADLHPPSVHAGIDPAIHLQPTRN